MKIYWLPGEQLRAKAFKILQLRQTTSLTWDDIANLFERHRVYLMALNKWALENKDKYETNGKVKLVTEMEEAKNAKTK